MSPSRNFRIFWVFLHNLKLRLLTSWIGRPFSRVPRRNARCPEMRRALQTSSPDSRLAPRWSYKPFCRFSEMTKKFNHELFYLLFQSQMIKEYWLNFVGKFNYGIREIPGKNSGIFWEKKCRLLGCVGRHCWTQDYIGTVFTCQSDSGILVGSGNVTDELLHVRGWAISTENNLQTKLKWNSANCFSIVS